MPRSRGSSGILQEQSPRAPLHLKTTACLEANSRRLDNDRRSPRISPLQDLPKKRGTRVAELKTKLGQAQEELKKLKEQLASAEAANRDAQKELLEARKLIIPVNSSEDEENIAVEIIVEEEDEQPKIEATEENMEVTMVEADEEAKAMLEEIKKECDLDDDRRVITDLRAKLEEKNKELQSLVAVNEHLKIQAAEVAFAKRKEDELDMKLSCIDDELKEIRTKGERLKEQLETADVAKTVLEAELRKLRVQTNQWRKAAETAAAILTAGSDGGVGMTENKGRRAGDRCKYSMDKHLVYDMGLGSPLMAGEEDEFSGGKSRISGIRMFGDLWKKKAK